MIKKVKRIMLTIGSAMVSLWFLILWTILLAVTGVLLLIDLVHRIWTERRIPWIKKVTDTWGRMFNDPFGSKS